MDSFVRTKVPRNKLFSINSTIFLRWYLRIKYGYGYMMYHRKLPSFIRTFVHEVYMIIPLYTFIYFHSVLWYLLYIIWYVLLWYVWLWSICIHLLFQAAGYFYLNWSSRWSVIRRYYDRIRIGCSFLHITIDEMTRTRKSLLFIMCVGDMVCTLLLVLWSNHLRTFVPSYVCRRYFQ